MPTVHWWESFWMIDARFSVYLLARNAFVRTNRRAIAMMFVRLFVCQSGTGVHCNSTVHGSMNLSSWLDSPMFWAPGHQSMSIYFQPSCSSSAWKRGWVWTCKLGMISRERLKIEVKLLLSANRKWFMLHQLAQQQMTLSDIEWPFHITCIACCVCAYMPTLPLLVEFFRFYGQFPPFRSEFRLLHF